MQEKNINIDRQNVSIIIPSYNGKDLLRKNLPYLLKAVRPDDEIIVVDDGGTDSSVEYIKNTYPDIRVTRLEKNQGFSAACNRGAQESKNDLIYFLNNDIEVTQNVLNPLLAHFQEDNMFAVKSREITPGSEVIDFDMLIHVDFRFGVFWYRYEKVPPLKNAVPILFADGGHTMFNKEKFLSLGGFDELYCPAYWEDWDISYRARKMGYEIIYEPQSEVYHNPKTTFGKLFTEEDIRIIQWRNHFLFIWKNIFSRWFLVKHIFFLPLEIALSPFIGKGFFNKAFFRALQRLPEALQARKRVRSLNYVFTDKELITEFSLHSLRKSL